MRWLVSGVLLILPNMSFAACRLALALSMDVSASVDAREYQLQFTGLAAALGDSEVSDALFALPEAPVAIAVYEWSASSYQRILVDWVLIDTPEALEQVRTRLSSVSRQVAPETTGLGQAMIFGHALIQRAPVCWDQTLDVSGDGINNDWPSPETVVQRGEVAGLRINGLVVVTGPSYNESAAELVSYFEARVAQGPNSFVEVALGFEDYEAAMKRKLLKELALSPVGQLPSPYFMRFARVEKIPLRF